MTTTTIEGDGTTCYTTSALALELPDQGLIITERTLIDAVCQLEKWAFAQLAIATHDTCVVRECTITHVTERRPEHRHGYSGQLRETTVTYHTELGPEVEQFTVSRYRGEWRRR